MKVPFLDVGAAYRELKGEIDSAVHRVLESGWYVLGPEVEAFEVAWADYCGVDYAVGVANGLDALILALRALEIGEGDEVIVPSNTYVATWLAVSAVGATPVPVEPDPLTHNLDPAKINDAISSSTRAIMPVHLYGQSADMDPIIALARKSGLALIEDGAQAHGARYKGRRIGGHGDIVCWSFYPGKNLGALGDGGAITTDRSDLADYVRILRNYGSQKKYQNEVRGLNSRLDPIQAAILNAKLPHLDRWTDRRRTIANGYLDALSDADIVLPHVPDWAEPVWHLFVVRTNERDQLQSRLNAAGINTLIHYPIPPHRQRAYVDLRMAEGSLPIAERLSSQVLSLPIGPHMTHDDTAHVIKVLKN